MIAQLFLVLLFPMHANAANLKCELELGLIDDSISTESKQLRFESEVQVNGAGNTSGTMIAQSCFGKIVDPWTSAHSQFRSRIIGDRIVGIFTDALLSIGNHQYQLELHFAQLKKDPQNPDEPLHLIARGKLISLDQADFIHQKAAGECHLSH